MEEGCEVGPKNLRKNFGVEEFFSARNVFGYLPVLKKLNMSTPKPDDFMQLFWKFVGVPVWPKWFLCSRNLYEYFTKFIPSKFLNFLYVSL